VPTVFRHDGFRVFFYSNEGDPREPVHVHVRRDDCEAKVWVDPAIAVAESYGFNAATLGKIIELIELRREQIEKAWHEHFGN
jgi:hypothetical protein